MRTALLTCSLACSLALVPAVGAGAAAPAGLLTPLGTYASGQFGVSAAEITAFDPGTEKLFVVNAASGSVDVLDVRRPDRPRKVDTVTTAGLRAADGSTVPAGAVVNSVDVRDGVLAVAVEAPDKVSPGWVAFYRTSGHVKARGAVRVGSLPDMLTFSPDGRTVLVADEGEPADDFSSDPEGAVSLVDVSDGVRHLQQSDVRTARFTAWDTGRALPAGVRVFGPDVPAPGGAQVGRVARNLEPEYLTVDADSRTAYVTLQEANAVAVLDVRAGTFRDLLPLGTKDWSAPGNVLDASDRDGGIALRNWPVDGLPMPDTITSYRAGGRTWLVTADEGDAREWGDYAEPVRVGSKDYVLCPDAYPDAAALKAPAALGRLQASRESGLRADGSCYERITAFGGRSFSIRSTSGELVFDSAGRIEQAIAAEIAAGRLPASTWNSTNDENPSTDSRSDDKGPEPEGVAVGQVGGRTYAFVGLERIGGVVVFDVTDPRRVAYVEYVSTRDVGAVFGDDGVGATGDLGPEGLEFIAAEDSPTRTPLLAVANEVSGSTTLYRVGPEEPRKR